MSQRSKSYSQEAHEIRIGISNAEKNIALTNNRECLIPIDKNLTLCSKPTSSSHSIQRVLMRNNLSRPNNSMVLNFLPRATAVGDILYEQFKRSKGMLPIQEVAVSDDTEYWKPKPISVDDASANPFACGSNYRNHDRETFEAIEGRRVDFDSPHHQFLFDYRCVLYALEELYNVRNFHKVFGRAGLIPAYTPRSYRGHVWKAKWKKRLIEIEKEALRFRKVIPRLDQFKQLLDAILIEKDYSKMDHRVVDLGVPISVAAVAFDSECGAMVTVYPTNNTGDHKVIVSWHKEEMNPELERSISEIIQSIVSPGEGRVAPFLERILGGSYNVYTSADYFQEIPEVMQERIHDARKQNFYDNIHIFVQAMGELSTVRLQESTNSQWQKWRGR